MSGPALPRVALRRPTQLEAGIAILLLILLVALLAPLIAGGRDPALILPHERALPPSLARPFGTDLLGRDLFARVLYGARVSLMVGLGVAAAATLAGTLVGVIAGYVRPLDGVLMRMVDGLMSIPPVLLAVAMVAVMRGSVFNVILAIALAELPRVVRLARASVQTVRGQLYVQAAITSGARTPAILIRHILPNIAAAMFVQATFIGASAIMLEAVLSFVGAGIPPTTPTWGNIMAEGRSLWQVKPHILVFPAILLCLTVLGVNLLGDGLRDRLDPRGGGAG
ncbi:ABC transporter permease [Sphingomonas canadensis]|uniref:ABC transporter permease n=1 Tax=Sphingomonas canadensis TaxID=1219257 RepID=A0ABW3H5D2_9SPHN|nr:ABC transporter permease [Sphingomonas canadensis]MCW3836224.1 ABC transporter permease [Sphingomonas canadensis]